MLRSEEEKDLTRSFARIVTWGEFLKRWKCIETEQEAVGLLYAGAAVLPFGICGELHESRKREEIEKRIAFYFRVARHHNERVSSTAQRVIVKHWLREMPVGVMLHEQFARAAVAVLEFLYKGIKSISEEPHPRFVSEWLENLYEGWLDNSPCEHVEYSHRTALRDTMSMVPGSKKYLVKTLCAWGMAYMLCGSSSTNPDIEVIQYIEEFLRERKYDPGHALEAISVSGPELTRRYSNVRSIQNQIAARTFLQLQFYAGGFNASFNNMKKTGSYIQKLPV
jgi:hypothetical protein